MCLLTFLPLRVLTASTHTINLLLWQLLIQPSFGCYWGNEFTWYSAPTIHKMIYCQCGRRSFALFCHGNDGNLWWCKFKTSYTSDLTDDFQGLKYSPSSFVISGSSFHWNHKMCSNFVTSSSISVHAWWLPRGHSVSSLWTLWRRVTPIRSCAWNSAPPMLTIWSGSYHWKVPRMLSACFSLSQVSDNNDLLFLLPKVGSRYLLETLLSRHPGSNDWPWLSLLASRFLK